MPDLENETQLPELRFPEFRDRDGFKKTRLNKLLVETKTRNRDGKFDKEHVLSVSGEFGCVNQIELLGRSYAGVSVDNYHVVETGDIVYTKSPLKRNPFGIIKENKGRPGIVSTLYAVYRTTDEAEPSFLDHFFSSDYNLNVYLQPLVNKGAKNDMKVKNSDVLLGEIFVPRNDEQERISEFLASLDSLIEAESNTLDALREHKKGMLEKLFPPEDGLSPEIRFPEFQKAENWSTSPLEDLIETVTPPKKLQTKDYRETGALGVVDQSPLQFVAWTDDTTAAIDATLPLIVFGDHTCTLKLATERFAQGADGIKVFDGNNKIDTVFLFHFLESRPVNSNSYRRHFALLKEVAVSFPDINSGEQQKIGGFLQNLDSLLRSQSEKVDGLKMFKLGLIQCLFPAPEVVGA